MYLDNKEDFEEDELAEIANSINSPEWKRLAELGLVEDEDAVRTIVNGLNDVIKWLDDETKNLIQIEQDLNSIQRQHKEFEHNAEKYFMDFLEEEIADGHIS
jgi:hypothetical protein